MTVLLSKADQLLGLVLVVGLALRFAACAIPAQSLGDKKGVEVASRRLRTPDPIATPLNAWPALGSDAYECEVIARNLVRGAGFRGISSGQPQEHFTAYRPPVTPAIWAVFFAVFGHRFDVIRLADIFYGTASVLLLFLIGRRMFNARVGLIAAAMMAVWPSALFLTGLWTETLYVMLELLFVWLCLRAGDRPTLARFVAAGLCAGVATLTRPNLLILLPLLPFWSAVVFRRDRRALVMSLAVPVAAVAVIAPWTYRNYRVFHKFIPVSTLSGTNLLQGNNDQSLEQPDLLGYWTVDYMPKFQERARGMDEAERDELAAQMAKAWLMDHRDQWGLLAWNKLEQFWSPFLHQSGPTARWAMLLSWGIILPLALPAMLATCWGFARGRHAGLIVHALVLSALAAYLIVYVVPRYRFPIEPFFVLMAAATVDWPVSRLRRRRPVESPATGAVPVVA